jgi:ribosomal protein S18 acetylase RimI-like enzyme
VLGYAVIFHRSGARVARLHSLAVDPAARGLGIGAALLLAAERAATQRRLTRLRLAVRADNDAGIALYRSRGYTELGRELAYYTDGMSAIRMEKALAVA